MNSPHTLVVTVEHSATGKMGGIGSYNAETHKLSDGIFFLLVDDDVEASPRSDIILCKQYIAEFLPDLVRAYESTSSRNYVILQVVLAIIQTYTTIKKVSTHEYSGLGSCIAQAAATGLLPDDVHVRTHCHGGHVQLERATAIWQSGYLNVLNAERASIENADDIYFPARYIYDLYAASGIKMQEPKVNYLAFPYDLHKSEIAADTYVGIENVIFIGRVNALKGYDVFADVVDKLAKDDEVKKTLQRVTVVGNDDHSMTDRQNVLKKQLADLKINYKQELMTRDSLLTFIGSHYHNSLFVLPYYSDNYSVAMLEIIEAGAPLLALDTGGTRDLIDSDAWRNMCLADNGDTLSDKALHLARLTPEERSGHCLDLRDQFFSQQVNINKKNATLYANAEKWERTPRDTKASIKLLPVGVLNEGSDYINPVSGEPHLLDGAINPQDYYLVYHHKLNIDKDAVKSIQRALRYTPEHDSLLTFYHRVSDHEIYSPQYSSYGQFIAKPNQETCYTLAVPGSVLDDFLKHYRAAPRGVSAAERTEEHFLAAFTYTMHLQERQILPIPKILASGNISYDTLKLSEKNFFDFAHYGNNVSWDKFRYSTLIRHSIKLSEEVMKKSVIDTRTDEFLSSESKSSIIVRKLLRHQVSFVIAVKKLKRRLFP